MDIHIERLSKKFQYEWIFREVSLQLQNDQVYTIIGPNGSGKSTLLQIIAGIVAPTKGTIHYTFNNQLIPIESLYKHLIIAAPYLELIEEFSLTEFVNFHTKFKKFRENLSTAAFIERLGLKKSRHKPLKYFSSGMKQRVKLGLAFYADTPLILLDEPTSNLDEQGINWYKEEIKNNIQNRLLVICSNQAYEYDFCENIIDISNYKT